MTRYPWLVGALALAMACSPSEPPASGSGIDYELALAKSKHQKDSLIMLKDSLLQEKEKQLSLQSQLIGDAATSARLVSEIASDLSKTRIEVKGDTLQRESAIQTASDELAVVQKKVKVVISRLNASEARIRRMRNDSASMAKVNAQQAATLAEYERSIAQLRETVTSQTAEIAMLTASVDSMSRVNVALNEENQKISAENVAMAAHEDSVFVVFGTERELAEKGIVRREGGRWFTLGLGKALVPARTFSPADFQVLSKTRDVTIQLPDSNRVYEVVSRQSLEYTDVTDPSSSSVKGELHVTDPGKFWAASRYLILVSR